MSAPAVDVVRCDCGNAVPPDVMVTQARYTGAPVAVCAWCDWRCGYWDCACDLVHRCIR